jgi:hypothetical protein
MKTTDLRNTVLILAGILLATFLVSAWWISRQAIALKQITRSLEEAREAHKNEKDQLTATLTKRDLVLAEIEVVQRQQRALGEGITKAPSRFPFSLMHRAKRGFNDIQAHVARGEFKGLALTDGYMELKRIFDNPAFDEMLANDHGAQGQQE